LIARVWRGWAPVVTADDYERHYREDVARNLGALPGFRGARLLRGRDGASGDVVFTSIAYFDDLAAVRAFAGPDPERAVVEDVARRALSRWDDRVSHHEVVVEVSEGRSDEAG
jgi:heme-degrading monooxygenase HmoA